MRILRCASAVALAVGCCACNSANAVTISTQEFMRLGGYALDRSTAIHDVFEKLRQQSVEPQFLAVGKLVGAEAGTFCTATWIGDSADNSKMYLLTTARCAQAKTDPDTGMMDLAKSFFDWKNEPVAIGSAVVFTPGDPMFNTTDAPANVTAAVDAMSDMAILEMPKMRSIVDGAGAPIAAPMLYMGAPLVKTAVSFVGEGVRSVEHFEMDPIPADESSRALGQSVLAMRDGTGGLMLPYVSYSSDKWAHSAPGDEGAGLWQQTDQGWALVGLVTGMSDKPVGTPGLPLAAQVDWLKSLLPANINTIDTANAAAPSARPVKQTPPADGGLHSSPLLSPFAAPLSAH